MSATSAKADRRAVRRALGEDNLALLRKVELHGNTLEQRLGAFDAYNAQAHRDLTLELALKVKTDTAILRRPFFGRLKWIVIGR